jgi:hypothetical protein
VPIIIWKVIIIAIAKNGRKRKRTEEGYCYTRGHCQSCPRGLSVLLLRIGIEHRTRSLDGRLTIKRRPREMETEYGALTKA